MSKRSTIIIKRSLLPLASFTLGGCGMLGLSGHRQTSLPPLPPANPVPQAIAPAEATPAQDEASSQAAKNMLAFADRLAKAERPDKVATREVNPDGSAPVVLASDEHVVSTDQPAQAAPASTATNATPAPKLPAVEPVMVVPAKPVEKPATVPALTLVAPAPADPKPAVADTQPTAAMSSLATEPRDAGPALSAMGAMNATATPAVASLVSNVPSISEANTAATGPEPSMDSVLDLLRRRVQAKPQQLNYSLALALLEAAEMRKADDPVLTALNPSDQKLVTDLAGAVEAISAQPISTTTALADRAGPLLSASQRWQSDADLKLPRLSLATRVDSFGVYTPIEPRFVYGKRQTVIIYCEVANFACKRSDDGWYQTTLAQQDTLTTDDGLLVWRPNPEDVEDRSMNQRRDFYLVKKLTLPENLAIGKYTLKMSVTDKLAKKRAEVTMPIEIVAK